MRCIGLCLAFALGAVVPIRQESVVVRSADGKQTAHVGDWDLDQDGEFDFFGIVLNGRGGSTIAIGTDQNGFSYVRFLTPEGEASLSLTTNAVGGSALVLQDRVEGQPAGTVALSARRSTAEIRLGSGDERSPELGSAMVDILSDSKIAGIKVFDADGKVAHELRSKR